MFHALLSFMSFFYLSWCLQIFLPLCQNFSSLTGNACLRNKIENESSACSCTSTFLPKVIPLGHSIRSETSTCRSTPFSPAFSILACIPQSDQYMNLMRKKKRIQVRNQSSCFCKVSKLVLANYIYRNVVTFSKKPVVADYPVNDISWNCKNKYSLNTPIKRHTNLIHATASDHPDCKI